jgi:hypothetical protein
VHKAWFQDQNLTGADKALFEVAALVGEDGFTRCMYNTAAETFRLSSQPLRIHHDYRAAHTG